MHIGLVGLGKMGNNMRARLRDHGIDVTGYDPNQTVSDVPDLGALAAAIPAPRIVWVMVPSGPITTGVITDLAQVLEPGDLVIEGGNSRFTEDAKHAALLAEKNIHYVDCGVSGGIWGHQNGYGLMAGGEASDIERALPVFDALRPEGPRDEGFVHAGGTGAGHYAKMVHNGIEYALMQAWAEGYELLDARDDVKALEEDPEFEDIEGYVEDSGEGRWTVEEALNNAVPVPTISASIFARFVSRQKDSPSMKAVAALRKQFGGHAVRKA
jgi:6-phosphogluconate dehydrogenase